MSARPPAPLFCPRVRPARLGQSATEPGCVEDRTDVRELAVCVYTRTPDKHPAGDNPPTSDSRDQEGARLIISNDSTQLEAFQIIARISSDR